MKQLLGRDLDRLSWHQAEPVRLERELAAMAEVAPGLVWDPGLSAGGAWSGPLPLWPFDRASPAGLDQAVPTPMHAIIRPFAAHPAVEPCVYPLDPSPSVAYRTAHTWHLRGDGSLCLLQVASDWTGRDLCAQLAIKASGWYLEYRLLDAGIVSKMTLGGIAATAKYDAFLHRLIDNRAA